MLTSLVWKTDTEGNFTQPQPGWEKYTGQSWQAHQGWGWSQAIHPDDREPLKQAWLKAQSLLRYDFIGRIWNAEHQQYHFFETRGIPLLNPDGTIREWIGTVTDVNDRKRAEEQYQAIFDQVIVGVAQMDLDGTFIHANHCYCAIVGRSHEELITLNHRDVTHPDDLPQNLARLQQLIENKKSFEIEKRFIHPDGSWVWVRNHVSLLTDATGEPQRILCVSENITEHKRSAMERENLIQALATERARFEAVLRQMPAGVMIADAKTRSLELANEQVREIIGHCYEIGQVLEEYDTQINFHGADREQIRYLPSRWPLVRSLDTGESITNEEAEIQRADGQTVFINMNSAPIRDEQGQVTAAVVVFQDITEQKQAEAALRN